MGGKWAGGQNLVDEDLSEDKLTTRLDHGVFTFTEEYASTIPPARLFKALIVDSHHLIPKLWPQAIKSIDILRGSQLSSMKNSVDELNKETFVYKHTMIDLEERFESIAYEVKFEPTPDGGSKNRMTSTYYVKGDIETGKERALGMYKVVEAFLLQNPNAYV
ncbi:major allergen Pru ar 1 [Eucalyptus grandis]|uniref:major allergen Pru ar 1 n=1 Tax=Eucalyptus grandis TaxID=71139 RepID=UPI00192E850D|nr:major allergen Pru ar 1 [Eucalyptus grandis]